MKRKIPCLTGSYKKQVKNINFYLYTHVAITCCHFLAMAVTGHEIIMHPVENTSEEHCATGKLHDRFHF